MGQSTYRNKKFQIPQEIYSTNYELGSQKLFFQDL